MDNNEGPPGLSLGMVVFVNPVGMDWSGEGMIVGFEEGQIKLRIRSGLMTILVSPESVSI